MDARAGREVPSPVAKLENLENLAGQELRQGLRQDFGEVTTLAKLDEILERLDAIEQRLPGSSQRASQPRETRPSRREYMAGSFIEVQLRLNGPMAWKDLVAAGAEHGHAERTMERGRYRVAVSEQVDGRWVWRLRNRDGSS